MSQTAGRESVANQGAADAPHVDTILTLMTLDEKIHLMSGQDFWSTRAVPRVGVPSVRLTDGPNGARGDFAGTATAACFPVGAALAATWDLDLVRDVAAAIGEDAKTKSAQVVLGPTINLQRTPIGGRNFECLSEDPVLTAELCVAYVEGIQAVGVGACPKHFVGNDTEFQRHAVNSVIDESALRELYLYPFEEAVSRAQPWTIMSAYNRVNGVFSSSHTELTQGVLKDEWGFDGVVVSDWGAALETIENANGGLDLEMPGPSRVWGDALKSAVEKGAVATEVIDDHARRILRLLARTGALDEEPATDERSVDLPAHRALARRAASASMVLMKNERNILPLDADRVRRLAIIGPNAALSQIQGGGSSSVRPHYSVSALNGIKNSFISAETIYEQGCLTNKYAPAFPASSIRSPDGVAGVFAKSTYKNAAFEGEPELAEENRNSIFLFGMIGLGNDESGLSMRLEADFIPDEDGLYVFGVASAGLARIFIDDVLIVDNFSDQRPGDSFFGFGSAEKTGEINLEAGKARRVRIEYVRPQGAPLGGIRYGVLAPTPADLIDRAVAAAKESDRTVVVIGSNSDWETEGSDRADMTLPGDQDALVDAVLNVDPDAIIVVNAGAPVEMPWFDRARCVLWAWFGGQEFGNALGDILNGTAEPSGRTPLSFPRRLADHPAFDWYPGEDGDMPYKEGLFVGYRHYDRDAAPDPLVPFGFGLGYGDVTYADLECRSLEHGRRGARINLKVRNAGDRPTKETIQIYVGDETADGGRPAKALKAFELVDVDADGTIDVEIELPRRAFAAWDVERKRWRVAGGSYRVWVVRSAADPAEPFVVYIEGDAA